ncbi:MAG TPA: D-aminoacyl-tRNA deacylase [Bryobacteraceae bacterium]|jgi:D-tyrosyl-tRNA(Tyr) deacylase|nr:D-aminoacyl-tRNA deacylase [Bryobacteraceae bacterium]
MRLLVQRVSEAKVGVNNSTVGAIGSGLLVFVGISRTDKREDAEYLLDKLHGIRIFPDQDGKMNLNVEQAGGSLLLISQFTLYADCRRGRRPSFDQAAPPEDAKALYDYFVQRARQLPIGVETGIFQEMMRVELVNEGPVTIWLDSADRKQK